MNSHDVLGPRGLLARHFPGYEDRPQQIEMAALIEERIDRGGCAVIEAGTGTGKSLAYLTPGILLSHRAIVSTANKTLQAQLVHKDLPLLREVLAPAGYDFTFCVAKGKTNYLCIDKVRTTAFDPTWEEWIGRTKTGDIDEAPFTLSAQEQRALCCGDDCHKDGCQHFSQCFYFRAKAERNGADVVVTNHAQLCMQIEHPYAAILPAAPVLIVDEAHQLESYAVNAYSLHVSAAAFRGPLGALRGDAEAWLAEIADRRLLGRGREQDALIEPQTTFGSGQALAERIEAVLTVIEPERATTDEAQARANARHDQLRQEIKGLAERVRALSEVTPAGCVRHVTRQAMRQAGDRLQVEMTRFDVSELLGLLGGAHHTVVYTSATLASGPDDFGYFKARNGVPDSAQTLQLDSPFDFAEQCRLYLPMRNGMPIPDWRHRDEYDAAARAQMLQLVTASRGGAMLLFTSHYAMQQAERWLSQELPPEYEVRCQGQQGKQALIDWLKSSEYTVLCATASFWEGVDVPGDALRLVVIDKIPFASPSPVEQARQDAAGRRAFIELSVPEACLRLRQGFGRLIRTRTDHGVVALLDPRLWQKGYGRKIIAALPDATVVTSIAEVRSFFEEPEPQPLALGAMVAALEDAL